SFVLRRLADVIEPVQEFLGGQMLWVAHVDRLPLPSRSALCANHVTCGSPILGSCAGVRLTEIRGNGAQLPCCSQQRDMGHAMRRTAYRLEKTCRLDLASQVNDQPERITHEHEIRENPRRAKQGVSIPRDDFHRTER